MRNLAAVLLCLGAGALLLGASGAAHPPGVTLAPVAALFRTSDRCMACHSGVTAPSGEDVSIGYDWRASMMANSARDPYWQAAVRREALDHPAEREAIEAECSKCHMPMAHATAEAAGGRTEVFAHLEDPESEEALLALDGVSCALCHQILPDGLGSEESFTGGFRIDPGAPFGERSVFGPLEPEAGRARVMHSATGFRPERAEHLQTSELCATCHSLTTHALGAGAGQRLPEQMPYQEWRASEFAPTRSCQSCHMPEVPGEVAVASVLGQPRSAVSRHTFLGGNFFMLRMLNRYRRELGVVALPQELENAALRTVAQLQAATAAVAVERAEAEAGRLEVDVSVSNLTGHKLPTGYPSRRVWLEVVVRDAAGRSVFASGSLRPDGSVAGSAHDEDALAWEPHWRTIERPDQVQIYESVMADPQGRPTTGLLTATHFVKDNRLLPRGFDAARAGAEAAVAGDAAGDPDFGGGGDRVRYSVDLAGAPGPYAVEVRLWFQPIAFRWAHNLAAYDAPEPRRFLAWYQEMAGASALVLAEARAVAGGGR